MTLVVDNRAANPGPGLHALVIGVSAYDHLPGYDDPAADATWRLRSTGSTALSAWRIAEWIQTATFARPLKTLRVLLSPTVAEQPLVPAATAVPTQGNVRQAMQAWRRDCADSPDSIALLYYAGHGLTRGRGDDNLVLTMSDLFDPTDLVPLSRAVLASNLFYGMAPQTAADTIARQQIYFFDCCRAFPAQMMNIDDRSIPLMLPVQIAEGVPDNRLFARFYAVPDNDAAFAAVGRVSYFTAALLDALVRSGRNLTGQWCLDGEAIARRLRARYARSAGRRLVSEAAGDGPLLCNLAGPPKVDVTINLEPQQNAANRGVSLDHANRGMTQSTELAIGQHSLEVLPGEYELKVMPPGGIWIGTNDRRVILPDCENPWIARGWP